MRDDEKSSCRICGYQSSDPPWGEDNQTPLYDYCPCCGVEHGYQDASPAGAKKYRDAWISEGAVWDSVDAKPANWNLEEQLMNVPMDYR